MATTRKQKAKLREARALKAREAAFDTNTANDRLPGYNALFDANLRHYFENRRVQRHLYSNGMVRVCCVAALATSLRSDTCLAPQIDREGRIIDLEKNKAKLSIIEQEFKSAEAEEEQRLREEEEMRRRVQKKRHEALERARLAERMMKVKEDRNIRREIVRVTRGEMMEKPATKKKKKRVVRRRRRAKAGAGGAGGGSVTSESSNVFITEGGDGEYGDDALRLMGGSARDTGMRAGPVDDEFEEGEAAEY